MLFAIIKIYISIEKYVLSKKPTPISKLFYTLHKTHRGDEQELEGQQLNERSYANLPRRSASRKSMNS